MSMQSPSAAVSHAPVDAGTTDHELARNLIFGMVVGTPSVFLSVVLLCVVAGLGVGNSLAVAVLPAMFSGVFFGGIGPLLRQCARQEHGQEAARVTAREAAALLPVPVPVGVEALPVVPTAAI